MRLTDQLDRATQDLLRVSHALPDTLRAMRDAMEGHPGAQDYETPRTSGHATVVDERGVSMPAVSDRTGEKAVLLAQGKDKASQDHRELSRLVAQALQVSDRLIRLVNTYKVRPPTQGERDQADKANEKRPGCEPCSKVGKWNIPCTDNPTTVANNLEEPWLLCRWHWDFVRKTGRMATEAETKQYLDRPVDKAIARAVAS